MATIDNGKRIIDQDASLVINPEDSIIIDSVANGTRQITYENLCAAVAVTLGIAAVKKTADGAMQKSVYDADADGTVDNAEKLENHAAAYFATAAALEEVKTAAEGTMKKSVYDADGDGIVDNAAKVTNHTVDSDVPLDAKFTDTVYDDTAVKKSIGDNTETIGTVQKQVDGLGLKVVSGELCAVYS